MTSNCLHVLDTRDVWHRPLIKSARARGYEANRIYSAEDVKEDDGAWVFIRPHADPDVLPKNQIDDLILRQRGFRLIQDRAQVEVYENKSEQFRRWGGWMPRTQLMLTNQVNVNDWEYPVVSKANEGASSYNVRILNTPDELRRHAEQVFTDGVPVNCCSGGAKVIQRDYLLLQEFIPHDTTWRVNRVGNQYAIFKRYCYPDRPVAQTGNVEPVYELNDDTEPLLDYAKEIFDAIDTRWCALDILWSPRGWKLIETSLAWPWPSPGDCNNATFFPSGKKWIEMFDLMLYEMEEGAWSG